jgi:pilus assembly protein Flp/PilA
VHILLSDPASLAAGTRSLAMLKKTTAFLRQEQGATAIEYGLIVGLIAAVIMGILTTTGTSLNSLFTTVSGALP